MNKLDKALKRLNFLPLPAKELREFAETQVIFRDAKLTVNQLEQLLRMLDVHYYYVAKRTCAKICAEKEVWSDADQCFYDLTRGQTA